MKTSNSVSKIFTALNKAQGEMGKAEKNSVNPYHKSKYANLESVLDCCKIPLKNNGLAIIQSPSFDTSQATIVVDKNKNESSVGRAIITTRIIHTSGEWVEGEISLRPKDDTAQGVGACVTYARRYGILAFLAIADTDDDGNEASGKNYSENSNRITAKQLRDLENLIGSSNIDVKAFTGWIKKDFGVSMRGLATLTSQNYDKVVAGINQAIANG